MSDLKCPHCGMGDMTEPGLNWHYTLCDEYARNAETGRIVGLLYEQGGSLHRPDLTDSSYWVEDALGHIIGCGDTAPDALRDAAAKLGIETGGKTA